MPRKVSPNLSIAQQQSILFPSPEQESRMAIRKSDWARIKRELSEIDKPVPKLEVIYSVLFGFTGSSTISAFSFAGEGKSPALTELFSLLGIFSFVAACLFVWVDHKIAPLKKSALTGIQQDMTEVESGFGTPH